LLFAFYLPASPSPRSSALSLHDALPISFFCGMSTVVISSAWRPERRAAAAFCCERRAKASWSSRVTPYLAATFSAVSPIESVPRSEEHTSELQSRENLVCRLLLEKKKRR